MKSNSKYPENHGPAAPAPANWNPGYPTSGANTNTVPDPADSMDLPCFNITSGNTDTGVSHEGDSGGAG